MSNRYTEQLLQLCEDTQFYAPGWLGPNRPPPGWVGKQGQSPPKVQQASALRKKVQPESDDSRVTLFTWGYWGWGNATRQFIEAADAVETSRGFRPPFFVDIRIRRTGRAEGFKGEAFAREAGADRYRWADSLGNLGIKDGGSMRIKDPNAAAELLDLAMERASEKQRVIFFCACEFPGTEKEIRCHRTAVASLVLKVARKRRMPAQIVEWPGGQPTFQGLEVSVSEKTFKQLGRGRKSIPLGESFALAMMAAVPWGSLITARWNGDALTLLTGPAKYDDGEWHLPVLMQIEQGEPVARVAREVGKFRREVGYDPRLSISPVR